MKLGDWGWKQLLLEQDILQTNIFFVEYMAGEWLWNKLEENQ